MADQMETEDGPPTSAQVTGSVASKLTRVTLFILMGVAIATVTLVAIMNYRQARSSLAEIEGQIEEGLQEKGRGLAQNHALALRGMVYDNAFSDVESLIFHALREDSDIIYGVFLDPEGSAWTYVSPTHPLPSAPVVEGEGEEEEDGEQAGRVVAADAWKELGITAEPIAGTSPVFREAELFGQDIYEFAMPVVEDDEVLGSVRYGISTTRMHDALGAARAESEQSIRRQLLLLVGLGILTTFLGIVLVRREAVRVTRPLGALSRAADALASGDRTVRVDVQSNDEVEVLASSFNQMVAELRVSYDKLEERVAERTQELAARNRDMKKVFENVDQGFITLDREAIMTVERSAVVDLWFGSYDKPTSFVEFLKASDAKFSEYFYLAWDALTDGFLPLELCLQQLPSSLTVGEQVFLVSYSPLVSSPEEAEADPDAWDGVLVVIADVTERIAFEKAQAEMQEVGNAIKAILNDRQGFTDFYKETTRQVSQVSEGEFDSDLPRLKRCVHTIKGNTGIFGFKAISTLCHEIEDEMEELDDVPSGQMKGELNERWEKLGSTIGMLIGDSKEDSIAISGDNYADLLTKLQAVKGTELFDWVFSWQLEAMEKPLERLAVRSREIARQLGVSDLKTEVRSEKHLFLDSGYWSPFWSELVHVIRNAVGHGLSKDVENSAPTMSFAASQVDEFVKIEVRDNGVGIDWERVREKARNSGLPAASHSDLVDALFHDGLSTQTDVTSTAGRGVGMSAVKERVLAMDGTIDVYSVPGKGTTFCFKFKEHLLSGHLYEQIREESPAARQA